MKKVLKYSKENKTVFFAKIDELTEKNQFLACIEALESIPQAERDYSITYQLARAYQNFAIVGENGKATGYELGSELLKTSISILMSVKGEGENKAEWNMRMAYGYQYLEDKEELVIPYALRWAELDPSDEDAMLVVEQCKEAIKNRVKKHLLSKVYEIVEEILKNHKITGSDDYFHRDDKELEEIEEKIHLATQEYGLDEEDIVDVIDNVLEDFENNNKKIGIGNQMEKMNHKFFGELDLVKGLDDEMDFGDNTIVIWEEEINEITTTLWYGKGSEISLELLDTFSKFLNNFEEYHQKSLKELENYLIEEDEYIVFHKEELEIDVPEDTEKFVQSMKITNIGLWVDGENYIIVDYMISPDESDEILAVKFNENLEIVDISWES